MASQNDELVRACARAFARARAASRFLPTGLFSLECPRGVEPVATPTGDVTTRAKARHVAPPFTSSRRLSRHGHAAVCTHVQPLSPTVRTTIT